MVEFLWEVTWMALQYDSLDSDVRQAMVEEISSATASGDWYRSTRLTEEGLETWPSLLRTAATSHDDAWLEGQLRSQGFMASHEERTTKKGTKLVKVRLDAAELLAEGQFNFYYCLAVCLVAMASGEGSVEIYRARESEKPRAESVALEGTFRPAVELLSDLRRTGGIDTAIGLSRPGSGLSVRRSKIQSSGSV